MFRQRSKSCGNTRQVKRGEHCERSKACSTMPRPTGCEQAIILRRGDGCTNIGFQFSEPSTSSTSQQCTMTMCRSFSGNFGHIRTVHRLLSHSNLQFLLRPVAAKRFVCGGTN